MRDRWEDILREIRFDPKDFVTHVTADQIRNIARKEPRLMASMDSEEKRPGIFREHGVFVLPITKDAYAIVRGNGYHELEDPGSPRKFRGRFPFEMVMLAFGSGETRYLLHAYHAGLLSHFCGSPDMFETMSGKARGSFEFRVDGSPTISVQGAGLEVDKGYESPTDLLLFEAKAKQPRTFIIRQLYYPYRVASGFTEKRVRTFFFAANPAGNVYSLWEYRWDDPLDYEAINLVRSGSFIVEEEQPPVETLASIEPDPRLDIVPQADDFQKVADYPTLVKAGIDTARAWSDRYDIALRQGSYYREAAEALGLLKSEGGRFALTDEGESYVSTDPSRRGDFLAERILKIPLMNEVFQLVHERPDRGLAKEGVARMIAKRGFSGTTPLRRASTVFSWFQWLSMATGAVVVVGGLIRSRSGPLDRFVSSP